jgi:hypothetical protein
VLGLVCPSATEDAPWRRVIAGRAPPSVAGRVTYLTATKTTASTATLEAIASA